MSEVTLVIATRNRHKLREMREILDGLSLRLEGLDGYPEAPEVDETGQTFEENALLKARSAVRATGHWALADDSGLEVDALGGKPGILSSRFAGPDADDASNRQRLLEALDGVPAHARRARFVCVVAVVSPGGEHRLFRGECHGVILDEMRGTGGFGYDPLFLVPSEGKTMAELAPARKNALSHRGRALRAARPFLEHIAANGLG